MKKFSTDQKLTLAKKATSLVVQYGTGIIVTGIIINNAMPKNTPQKIGAVVAGVAISMMCREKMADYTDKKFDETVATVKRLLTKEDESVIEGSTVEA